jgi:hypothetical protein
MTGLKGRHEVLGKNGGGQIVEIQRGPVWVSSSAPRLIVAGRLTVAALLPQSRASQPR